MVLICTQVVYERGHHSCDIDPERDRLVAYEVAITR